MKMKGCRYFKSGWCCLHWKEGEVLCGVRDKKDCNKEKFIKDENKVNRKRRRRK
jgi:hypothetical protein